jgi:hypothetical protein
MWFGVLLGMLAHQVSAADGTGILTNLLAKAHSVGSYHYKMNLTGTMDPEDSCYMFKTKIVNEGELWARTVAGTTLFYEVHKVSLKAVEHPKVMNNDSNLVVFDGSKYYWVSYQTGLTNAYCLEDPTNSCRMFLDPETILTKLMADTNLCYLSSKKVNQAQCQVFESASWFFITLMNGVQGKGKVEIAIDENSGMPVLLSLKAKKSSSKLSVEKAELNLEVRKDLFKAPGGVEFQDAEPDGLGGFRLKRNN